MQIPLHQLAVGQVFLDEDHALCVYLGFARETKIQELPEFISIRGVSLEVAETRYEECEVYAMFYKNSWSLHPVKPGMKAYAINPAADELMKRMSESFVGKHDWYCGGDE